MTRITAAEVAELRDKATPGPWAMGQTSTYEEALVSASTGETIARAAWDGGSGCHLDIDNQADVEFIARAHDMADLCIEQDAEIKRLRAEQPKAEPCVHHFVDAAITTAGFALVRCIKCQGLTFRGQENELVGYTKPPEAQIRDAGPAPFGGRKTRREG